MPLVASFRVGEDSETKCTPGALGDRWVFPHMPDSLERLDLLLLTVAKTRWLRQDGIRFQRHRYVDPTTTSYVKEDVLIRYDPVDMTVIHVFYQARSFFVSRDLPKTF